MERNNRNKDMNSLFKMMSILERSEPRASLGKVCDEAKSRGIEDDEIEWIMDALMKNGNIYFPDKDSVSVVPKC